MVFLLYKVLDKNKNMVYTIYTAIRQLAKGLSKMTYTPALNFKGSIRSAARRHIDREFEELLSALSMAARAMGTSNSNDAIQAEMNERLRVAFAIIEDDHGEECPCRTCTPPRFALMDEALIF